MPLTPDEIAEKEFAFGLRGYDQAEVREFLTLIAAEVADGSLSGVPAPLTFSPDAAGLEGEAAQVLERAHAEAAAIRRAAEADAEIAQSRAEAVLGAAESAALRLVAEAHARIDQRLAGLPSLEVSGTGSNVDAAPASTVDYLGAEISALVNAREDILQQLQLVRARVADALEAAEVDQRFPSLSPGV